MKITKPLNKVQKLSRKALASEVMRCPFLTFEPKNPKLKDLKKIN